MHMTTSTISFEAVTRDVPRSRDGLSTERPSANQNRREEY
jgi:hypothetical protein